MRRTRPALSSAASPVSPWPALLLTSVRLQAPCSISASIRSSGIPAPPKPPTAMVAPSGISAKAAWTLVESLSIMDGVLVVNLAPLPPESG
ncbi:hypothetical protein D3C87_1564010 [compost metagenome]